MPVLRENLARVAIGDDLAVVKYEGAAAEALERWMIVSGSNDNTAAVKQFHGHQQHPLPEVVVEGLVHLVKQQHVRVRALDDGEAEACPHALGVARYRSLECLA